LSMLGAGLRPRAVARRRRGGVAMKPTTRTRLPDRRPAETFDVKHNGERYHVSIGRFPDGAIAELFIVGSKSGSDLAAVIHDAAVALSIAAQYGVPLDVTPGSHPHSDRPNWGPSDDDAEELLLQKIADAIRDGQSERHIAKLLGISRMMLWRGRAYAAIPP